MIGSFLGILGEIRRAARVCGNLKSFLRLSLDLLLCRRRLLDLIPAKLMNKERTVRLSGGITLTYRLNKGDIWSLREIWLFDCYEFPADIHPQRILDLGANIGLTSVWLATRYRTKKLVAVEPVTSNETLARRNLKQNNLDAVVIPAAIGCKDGSVTFIEQRESTFGKADYAASGATRLISMSTLLDTYWDEGRIDLVKLDIEGGEQELLSSNLEWLQRVDAIIAEFHPDCVDYPALVAKLQQHGFRYIPANSVFRNNMDSFIREPSTERLT
jgi:FkbM family methyltransferase